MTKEERAIQILEQRACCMECVVSNCNCAECDEAFDMAIKALEQEPVRHGKWIYHVDSESIDEEWVCSECNGEEFARTKFCPHCGARMDEK